jgi:hypothetical protein
MKHISTSLVRRSIAVLSVASILVACGDDDDTVTNVVVTQPSRYNQTNLVSDVNGFGALNIDPNLVNAWGLAFGPTGILWVANEGTGTSTLYDVNGVPQSLVVTIPSATGATGGHPTGTVFNSSSDFVIPRAGVANFLFAGLDGTITGWSAGRRPWSSSIGQRRMRCTPASRSRRMAMRTSCMRPTSRTTQSTSSTATSQYVRSFTDPTVPLATGRSMSRRSADSSSSRTRTETSSGQ